MKKNSQTLSSDQGISPHTLFVSLYLVLLAFFILLNSISDTDKVKSEKALSSLNEVFASGLGQTDFDGIVKVFDFPFIVASYFDSVEGLMRSSFQLVELDVVRSGNKMRVTMPLDSLFDSGTAEISKGQKKTISRLADIMLEERKGAVVSAYIFVDSIGFSVNGKTNHKIDRERIKFVVSSLLSKGVPGEFVTGGVTFNNKNNLVIESLVQRADGVIGDEEGE